MTTPLPSRPTKADTPLARLTYIATYAKLSKTLRADLLAVLQRVVQLEIEVAHLQSPDWQQEQIDDYHNEVAKLRKKREKLYE